jgi:hypothetical protein
MTVGIIVLHASHNETWLCNNISPLCTYNPLYVHPDQWVTTFNNRMHHSPHLGFFLEIGEEKDHMVMLLKKIIGIFTKSVREKN